MKKILLLTLFIFSSWFTIAAFDNYTIGARNAAMGGTSLTLVDAWSTQNNQAGLAQLKNISGGIFYESRFMVPGVGLKGATFALPIEIGSFGVNVLSFGNKNYSENKIGLSYARKLTDNFFVGVQMNYMQVNIAEGYGNKGVFTAEVGFQANLTSKLSVAGHVYNPTRTKIADFNDEYIPTTIRLGANYTFSEKVFVLLEAEKDMDNKPVVKSGIEYHITKPLYLRGGIATNPFLSSFGVGLDISGFKVDISASYHSVLGYTPQLSILYNVVKK